MKVFEIFFLSRRVLTHILVYAIHPQQSEFFMLKCFVSKKLRLRDNEMKIKTATNRFLARGAIFLIHPKRSHKRKLEFITGDTHESHMTIIRFWLSCLRLPKKRACHSVKTFFWAQDDLRSSLSNCRHSKSTVIRQPRKVNLNRPNKVFEIMSDRDIRKLFRKSESWCNWPTKNAQNAQTQWRKFFWLRCYRNEKFHPWCRTMDERRSASAWFQCKHYRKFLFAIFVFAL